MKTDNGQFDPNKPFTTRDGAEAHLLASDMSGIWHPATMEAKP